jgi:flagellar biosynthetic protein FlhB
MTCVKEKNNLFEVCETDFIQINLQLFAEEKTEEATPHKKQEVRKEGQVCKSSDLNAVAVLVAFYTLMWLFYEGFIENLCRYITFSLNDGVLMPLSQGNLGHILLDSSMFLFKFMAPVFTVCMAAGFLVNFGQVGLVFAPKAIQPKLSNINPISGFKRMFSKRSLVELAKALLKVVVVGWVAFYLVSRDFENLLLIADRDAVGIFMAVAAVLAKVGAGCIGVFLVIAVFDYMFQRREFKERIKMTKKEVRDEYKQTEGDPLVKGKIREQQREMARRRMMQSVPEATVVITNPTHLAVALKYEIGEQEAPQVVAKGAGYVAQKIIEIAREHDVPIVENKPVARMLYKDVDIGEDIPSELYKAVAEILAMIFRLRKR